MFVNPFPFGNTNTIVDTISQGLPGVNRAHREVHSNIDRGLFRRLGLREELSATSEEEMISVAVKMIDDAAWRAQLSADITRNGLAEPLFRGQESHFCDHIVRTHQEHPMRLVNEPAKPLP
jgi:predicted O-linked N-acetylglucosamine transferase (SPINDLY family)